MIRLVVAGSDYVATDQPLPAQYPMESYGKDWQEPPQMQYIYLLPVWKKYLADGGQYADATGGGFAGIGGTVLAITALAAAAWFVLFSGKGSR